MSHPRRGLGRLTTLTTTMITLLVCLPAATMAWLRRLEERGREEDRDAGYSTEFMVITALLVAAAIAIVAVIAKKLMDKANGLDL
ncbi:conserved hypothetical protein [Frankia canadensis]|uniref:Uncharacterized protein n=1 Tax=Frankia canadensis TaxID=1836972 RepID=A0A2I2KX45_9ACTN|nr:hypothetical protein [Frankia canadensis]SNQ50242.1 conserved hypothetical protein [Frankia canadensis]SOU57532.1 conserved hypothetical protein [Frankia canadensis]